MDWTLIAITAILASVAIAGFLVFRQRGKAELKGPMGTELKLDLSNQPAPQAPGIEMKAILSRGGGV